MRLLITFATVVAILAFTGLDADGQKKEDIPKLINILKTGANAKIRVQAAEDIAHVGAIRASDAKDAIGPLLSTMKNDKEATVRSACAKALGGIGTHADTCVPALTEALKDSAFPVKISAATALGQFGPDASAALPALKELAAKKTDKDDKKLAQAALQAAKAITGKEKKK